MPGSTAHTIFGRERELGAMRSELAAAMQGTGRLLLLVGEPGIGKTTLVGAHRIEAEARGALVVWGRCHETPGAPPYWPWVQMLEALARQCSPLSDELVEELNALRESLRAEASRDADAIVDDHSRFELFARVARGLSSLAEKRGLVLVIDDLHWADAASVRLLGFLAAELAADPILSIATLRTFEPTTEPTLAALARLARTVPVGPLDAAAMADLLAERMPVLGEQGDPSDPGRAALVAEVCQRSEGNPFFVLELAHLLTSEAAERRPSPQPLSFGITHVLERRLARLPDATRRVLQAASVIGRDFDLDLLGRAVECGPAELRERLEPALELGVVVAQPPTAARDRCSFSHALTRETLYASLERAESARVHGRIALALEAGGDPAMVPALAHHFHAAGSQAEPEKAERYGFEAGSQMLRLYAYEESALHFERTLSLLGDTGDGAQGIRARIGLGRALLGAGDRTRATSVLAEAVKRADPTQDAHLFAEAVLHWSTAREETGVIDRESNAGVEAALERLPQEDSALRARLLARLSSGLHHQSDAAARRRELAEEAIRIARALGDPATSSFVHLRCMARLMGPDELDERLEATREMLAAAAGDPIGELNGLSLQADSCAERGDRHGVDAALAAFDEKARALRHPFFQWSAATFRAAIALVEGRYADAEAEAVLALQLGQRAQERTPMLNFAQQMFMLRAWQNRLPEIAPLVEGGADTTRIVPAWRCALANLYQMLGREADARREFEAVARDDFASIPRDTTWLTSMVLLASVCAQTADLENAAKLYRLMRPYAGRIAVGSPLVVLVGVIDQHLGTLASLLGRFDEAEAHFRDALGVADRMRALTWQAEIRFRHAEMRRARGLAQDTERAGALLDEAEAIARPVGMARLLEWIDEARKHAPAATPAASADARPTPAASFRREGDLWTLVFDGRTTRLRPMVGLAHLHRLLACPDQELHALDLVAGAQGHAGPAPASDAGPLLDERAREEYRGRLEELREELAQAQQRNDSGRASHLSNELEQLTDELSRGFGLGGRPRKGGSTAERARVSVTRAIRYAIGKIAEHDDALAQHLSRDVRTGTYCMYAPSNRDRVSWSL